MTIGNEEITDPDDDTGAKKLIVDFVGAALVVKDKYNPEYKFVKSHQGNHTFRIPVCKDLTYEYLIAGAWSEGSFLNTPDEFKKYVLKTAKEYNNPIKVKFGKVETK